MIAKQENYATLEEWLDRGLVKIYPSKEEFVKRLKSGKKITIYTGVDATGSQLHLGHSTNFFILKKLQEKGHKIIFLIGDFTSMIGDPSDKLATRQPLTREQVLKNCATYKEQAGKLLNFSGKNPVQIKFNSSWLSKLDFEDLIGIASHITVQQMIARDMFQERLKLGKNIAMHEFMYPLMQGYDSVNMKVDAEIGGNDQTFNMLMGRDLCKKMIDKEKFVLTSVLLENPKTGKKLMSKSEGSFVALNDTPAEMFGKIMSLPDEVILPCFKLCTELSDKMIAKIEQDLKKGANPRDIKAALAKEIIKIYHSEEDARQAEANFNRIFKDKEIPEEVKVIKGKAIDSISLIDFLFQNKMVSSKGEARRMIEQGGIKIDKEKITDVYEKIGLHDGMIFQVGKRNFYKFEEK